MHRPDLYKKANQFQLSKSQELVDKFLPQFNWQEREEAIVDIGSGTGDATSNLLLPKIKEMTPVPVTIRGVDISEEMVDYANDK